MTAGYFEAIEIELSIADDIIFSLVENPPQNEREWTDYYRQLFRHKKHIKEAIRNARMGREVAKANKVISLTDNQKQSARELIEKLQALLSESEVNRP